MDYTYLNYSSNGQNPMSFKELVLRKAKNLGLFNHLRDTYFEDVGDLTYEKWVKRDYGQDYYIKQSEEIEARIMDLQKRLMYFETDEIYHKAYLEQLEWDLCGKYKSMLHSIEKQSSYSFQHRDVLVQRKHNLQAALAQWMQYTTDNKEAQKVMQSLQNMVQEMIETVEKEIAECEQDAESSTESYNKYIQKYEKMTLEEKEQHIRNDLSDDIKSWTEQLKTCKRCIKRLEEEDEIIRILFDSLDKHNEEI